MRKHHKFLASSVAVSLVAAAVAPSALAATFTDTKGNTHEEAINTLVDAGVINGYPDGTFKPTKTLTRSDVVKLIGKYLVTEGYEIPKDYKSKMRFADIALTDANDELLKYAALIYDNEIFWDSGDKLVATQDMTREDMAIALVRLLNNGGEIDYVAFVENLQFKGDVTDLAAAKEPARSYIAVLDYFDITNPALDKFNPKSTTTRGQFATFLQKIIALKPLEISNFQATGVQSLTVTFNKIITTNPKITVKKDSTDVEIKAIEFAKDKRSAKIVLPQKLTAGAYDITVTGLSGANLSKSVTVADEKLSTIELPTDAAIPNAAGTKVRIPYKVENQYGEDITAYSTEVEADTTLSNTDLEINPAEGVIEISKTTGTFKLGDNISISLVDPTTSVSNSKIVRVSEQSKVAEVEVTSVYNDIDSEAALTLDSTYEDFHLVVNAVDQYGLEVSFQDIGKYVTVAVSDTSIIDVNKSVTTPAFSQLIINGQKKTVLELKQPTNKTTGKATVSITVKSTGKKANYDVEVAEGEKADEVSLTAPKLAVAGEKTEIPFEVRGTDGKLITNAVPLNKINGVRLTTNDAQVKVNIENDSATGKAKLVLLDTSKSTADRQVRISATTATMKSATLLVTVKAKAEPKKIKETKDLESNLLVGGTLALNNETVTVVDQYDRAITLNASNLATAATTANAGKYFIKVDAMDDKVLISANKTIGANNAVTVTGNKKGSDSVKLTLQKVDAKGVAQTLGSSAYEMNLKVIDKASIVSYEMKAIDAIYDNPTSLTVENYATELVVYGITADGKKLIVPKAEYTVITGHNDLVYNSTNGKLSVRSTKDIVEKEDKVVPVRVIINAARQPVTLDQGIVVTKKEPFAKSIELKQSNGLTIDDQVIQVPATTASVNISSADLRAALKITDQYGEDISTAAASRIKLTATNLVNADADNVVPTVTGNGTNTLTFKGVEKGDSFYLTYIVDGNLLTAQVFVGQ